MRAARPSVVVHCVISPDRASQPALIGFVVSKAVGNAVTRNLVKRRMRAVMRAWLKTHDVDVMGAVLVIRALPAMGKLPFDQLNDDVTGTVHTALKRCMAHESRPGRVETR